MGERPGVNAVIDGSIEDGRGRNVPSRSGRGFVVSFESQHELRPLAAR
jgi:hypothetical protein